MEVETSAGGLTCILWSNGFRKSLSYRTQTDGKPTCIHRKTPLLEIDNCEGVRLTVSFWIFPARDE